MQLRIAVPKKHDIFRADPLPSTTMLIEDMDISALISLVVGALETTPDRISDQTQASEIEEWDSLGHISILVALDEVILEVSESIPELASATSIPDLLRLLDGYPKSPKTTDD